MKTSSEGAALQRADSDRAQYTGFTVQSKPVAVTRRSLEQSDSRVVRMAEIHEHSLRRSRSAPKSPIQEMPSPQSRSGPLHKFLHEDAMARQQRLQALKDQVQQSQEREEQMRQEQHLAGMRRRQKYYRGAMDSRSHLEREAEIIRRRKETAGKKADVVREREQQELRECTFKPTLHRRGSDLSQASGSISGSIAGRLSPRRHGGLSDSMNEVQMLVRRQQQVLEHLQDLAHEEEPLREKLKAMHSELHERIQREETERVVSMLKDSDMSSPAQQQLVARVKERVATGVEVDVAQREIVEELVAQSQDMVRKRVAEAFGPVRIEAEGDLYSRQLAAAHDLEALEAQAVTLAGGTMVEEAKALGFTFGVAEQIRQGLRQAPSLVADPGSPSSQSNDELSGAMERRPARPVSVG